MPSVSRISFTECVESCRSAGGMVAFLASSAPCLPDEGRPVDRAGPGRRTGQGDDRLLDRGGERLAERHAEQALVGRLLRAERQATGGEDLRARKMQPAGFPAELPQE